MTIRLAQSDLGGFEQLARLEWIEANGIGGGASGTLSGANTRRYHGLLVAALTPPVDRTVLVAKIEESIRCDGIRTHLSSNRFPGVVHPDGHTRLTEFERDIFVRFTYEAGPSRLEKRVAAISGENTTVVEYRLVGGPPVVLEVHPFLTHRSHHSLGPDEGFVPEASVDQGVLVCSTGQCGTPVWIALKGMDFAPDATWYRNFEYDRERDRGFDYAEDLWTPGVMTVELNVDKPVYLILSTSDPVGRKGKALVKKETKRRTKLVAKTRKEELGLRALTLAADQFLVRRQNDSWTIIAGYPWFTDWGRDSMISLVGLAIVTGRYAQARDILDGFLNHLSAGMIPNRFPEDGGDPEYNTVDATLWMFPVGLRYWQATQDDDFARDRLLPAFREIVGAHDEGTRYGIRTVADGLLHSGAPGVQLTWMDAKLGDWVVTPRRGLAVEVNALWYNALRVLADFENEFSNATRAKEIKSRAERVRRAFNRTFWLEEKEYLADVVDHRGPDASLRPNQIFALSLPYPLLSKKRARGVLKAVREQLATPVGLRSLAPAHPEYRPRYVGGPESRDSAYHQGTVWGWLAGPYITALRRFGGAAGEKEAVGIQNALIEHLRTAGIGTISEIFDGDAPHQPRGAPAQAWSVAELLRVLEEAESE